MDWNRRQSCHEKSRQCLTTSVSLLTHLSIRPSIRPYTHLNPQGTRNEEDDDEEEGGREGSAHVCASVFMFSEDFKMEALLFFANDSVVRVWRMRLERGGRS